MNNPRYTNQYTPNVRLGNWFEDVVLEEEKLKDYLEKKDKGTLLIQRTSVWKNAITQPVELSVSNDGYVHFGDVIIVKNVRDGAVLASNVPDNTLYGDEGLGEAIDVSATSNIESTARSAFIVTSVDGSKEKEVLCYGQTFMLRTKMGNMLLSSDHATFAKAAKKSRHNEVSLVGKPSHLTEWMIVPFDPNMRLELDYTPVPANTRVLLNHIKANKNLCLEANYKMRTAFGPEFEVSCNTERDSHRVELDVNQWRLTMMVPGDCEKPLLTDK